MASDEKICTGCVRLRIVSSEIDFCNCGCVSVKLHDQSNSTNTAYLHPGPANVVITIQ